jgi:iron complex outermembrane receptor protein
LRAQLSYGYLDPEYNEYEFFDPSGQFCGVPNTTCDVSDRAHFAQTSKNTASASFTYEFEPFNFGTLSANLNVSYRSNYKAGTIEGRFDEDVESGDNTLINGRISLFDMHFAGGSVDLALWGKNLTDEIYPAFAISAFEGLGFAGANMSEERSYGLDLIYTY